MPKIKTLYDKAEEIPEGYAELYTERNGHFELTGVEGVKTQSDIDRVQEGLRKEKADHKTTKEKLTKFGDLDPERVTEQLSELEATKAQLDAAIKDGTVDPKKTEAAVDAAVKRALGPVEREKTQLQRDLDAARKTIVEKDGKVVELETGIKQSKIEGALRDAAIAAKVVPTAIDDAVFVSARLFELTEDGRVLTRDNVGVAPGLEPKDYYKDAQERRPHWYPQSVGGGSRGGGPGGGADRGANPWTKEGWNITKQGQTLRTVGKEKAAAMAAVAGVALGATKPAEKAA